jgi:glutathione S-transferase
MTILLYDLVGSDAARPFSPHCWKAAFALAHKGLPFKALPIRYQDMKSVEGGAATTLPLIRDGDRLVVDSFDIAVYLEETYPDRPTLFGGEGGKAAARFVERWAISVLHGYIGKAVLMDIHDRLDVQDQAHFRKTREVRFGGKLEDIPLGREEGLAGFQAQLEPIRSTLTYQPYLGGDAPLFTDHIVASAFQWARVISPFPVLQADDPVAQWFERCLDLYDGLARRAPQAA